MISKVTVIGGGSTGHAAAAYYALKGLEVTLYDDERFTGRLEKALEMGIQLRGKTRGMGNISAATTDPAQAIKGAELISVHVMASRHQEVAQRIAPYLEDGQHILIVPGNLGSFVFRQVFEEAGVSAQVTLTEHEGNICPCRLTGEAEVTVGVPLRGKFASSLPSSDTPKVLEALKGIWDFTPNRNVLEGAINANNVVMHIAPCVLSTTKIEIMGKDFILFQHGFTPTAKMTSQQIRDERMAVLEALEMEEHVNPMGMFDKILDIENNPQLAVFYTLDGPDSIDHRYLHEDCGCGAALTLSFARRLGIEMPVLELFVKMAGLINQTDYLAQGRTLENLGFGADLSVKEILARV